MDRKSPLLIFVTSLLFLSYSSLTVKPVVAQRSRAQVYTDITVTQAKAMLDTNPSLVLLDVRNQSEYDTRHIRNARLIPVWNLTQNLDELNKTGDILVYCAAGARSANASAILVSNGFLHVFNMLEGIKGWVAAGYPVYVKYTSVQAAISNATDGQTLYVSTGLYNESLSVDRSMTLVGEHASSTIINMSSNVVSINADNVAISCFTIQYTGCACYGYTSVVVSNCSNVNVTDNIIVSDDFGIRVERSRGVTVASNNVTHSGDASIVALDSSEVSVFGNDATGVGGIEIDNCNESTFWNNTVLCNNAGIFIAESHNNTVFGNNVSSIDLIGLSISSCYDNSFFDNVVSCDGPYEVYTWQSLNNSIFDNSFLGNGSEVLIYNSTDFWDNGVEGNYWVKYKGVDTNLDGTGDTPFVIDSANQDNHPLMGLFHTYDTSLNRNVDIVSNSSIDDFEYSEPNSTIMLQVSNTTADQTIGFCRMSIPHSLIDPYNGSISVVIDNGQTPVLFLNNTLYDDGTNRWIYFTYQQSTHSISVVPTVAEFPVFVILALFMIGTAIVAANWKKEPRGVRTCMRGSSDGYSAQRNLHD